MRRWAAIVVVLALGACGGDSEEPEPRADPSAERLAAACAKYGEAALAELPPASPAGYGDYVRERRRLVEEFIADVRKEAEGGEERPRLLAAASEVLSIVDELEGASKPGSFAGVMYTRAAALDMFDRKLGCGMPGEPSSEVRAFREQAAEVCEASGPSAGLPHRDAALVRERADGHAGIALPADAGDLERDTIAAEREAAAAAAERPRSPIIVDADARYIALVARSSAGWSRQQVDACADLPTPSS